MKVNGFTKVQVYVPEWNGNRNLIEAEQLRAELTVLTLQELIDVQDTLAQVQVQEGEKVSAEKLKTLIRLNVPVFFKHVRFTGGNEGFEVSDVAEYAHFFELAMELLKRLSVISQPSEQDVKN
jgi:hypothetical protein